ncbi:FKBP-type peptidyl-prolyl cis-trans isomerase [Dyadobacter sp. NIV53]|uniref:FKBP-type peptidyl-prolyl cis-trans isomerase n=1 Tax=Dyadobacter sp. NIV53 TaxID=2861765 RepID=UPI001C846916|nr:FKBP-type peptidyl-prolyl cis-trans isomerase [Dyadobacter sp. NIV53]
MIRNYLKLSMLVAFVVGMVSCNKGFDNVDEQKIIENENAIEKYIADSNITVVRDTSGLYYKLTANPTGSRIAIGEEATIRYNAYLLNGTKVWTSVKDTVKNFKYPYYSGYLFVLPGMERMLTLMRTGDRATIFLPYYLGFGRAAGIPWGYSTNANIPDYSAIRVDMEFVGKRSEVQQIDDFIKAKELTVTLRTTDNLVIVKTTAVATGDTLGTGKTVNVKYAGKLLDGTVFDPGAKPLSFVTGPNSGLITGFDRAIRKLKVGEKATIILPSALGYTNRGKINSGGTDFVIRPYQPITFDVEVL